MSGPLVNNFEVPSWAGKPPPGLHLDVLKDTKMVQKLMIDEKKCYFFGRNKQLNDFTIDHASCSRVHAALIWHKHLSRPFIIDLGSTHGTHIGTIRLESKKPQQVPIDSEIHFGASTRRYVIRERPQMPTKSDETEESDGATLLGLPETETELDNLTEFNTAHNRRISSMADIPDNPNNSLKRKKSLHINFMDDDEIINPEDIDPSVGKFRNLISTTVVPTKKFKMENMKPSATDSFAHRLHHLQHGAEHHHPGAGQLGAGPMGTFSYAAKLGLAMPNLAPDIAPMPEMPTINATPVITNIEVGPQEPRKKKYAKEAWPGKKPMPSLLV
ncbi:nuclear inhibitor of protein phosphatase 1-like [Tubulanus polymorphus]|uniref:nuclear inhibitor of protein phosphatase 1-like n=1 Tax=Tubulanus polymorphus TaxID=672921 RepID=UPI003DA3DBD4